MALVKTDETKKKVVVLKQKELKTPREVRTIVEEDEYVDKLGKIIQRDFFPDVPKLRAQCEYLEAVGRNDVAKIRALQERYSSTRRRTEQRASPTRRRRNSGGDGSSFEEPTPRPGTSQTTAADEDDDDRRMRTGEIRTSKRTGSKTTDDLDWFRLDTFLNKYTTEDNASFEELTELDRRRERIKNKWMYDAEKAHGESKVEHLSVLPGQDEQLMLPPPRPMTLDNWTYKARSTVLYHPEDAPLTAEELLKQEKMNQKEIRHNNTRFQGVPFAETTRSRPGTGSGQVDVTGQLEVPTGARRFGMVVTPSPAPGVAESPLMTWGEIEGTPFRLDASDMPMPAAAGPGFKIPEVPLRDKLAQDLTDTVAKRYRDKRKWAVEVAASKHQKTPRFGSTRSTTEQLVTLSPAARRLATNKLGIRLGSDKALSASYTPSPRRPSSSTTKTPVRTPTRPGVTTPTAAGSTTAAADSSSITDNLLKIGGKNRPRAADYF